MVDTRRTTRRRTLGDARGFTLVEFMIAALIMTAVLGGTVMLASQLQQGYSTQLDDVVVEQEVRYALDWIARRHGIENRTDQFKTASSVIASITSSVQARQ